ncbi:MAG: winged helix-turn-helix transcriptional regulator [Polyangiaceae bacterium]|nr:winged helix-turn-helix transcriptional regulator [Polyangiaceae bacterium]MCB9606292.1 winged helix-turn-helix transcriptional regulator [Polyangiaceae bacterium]
MSDLRPLLLDLARKHGSINCTEISEKTNYTRQAVHRHLRALVESGELAVTGRARATRYYLPKSPPGAFRVDLADPDVAGTWSAVRDLLIPEEATQAAEELTRACFVELLSNAESHAAAASAELRCRSHPNLIRFEIRDTGLGLFTRIRERLKLPSDLDALFALSKGPLTTQPAAHFGRGLFLVAAACQRFELVANGLCWVQDNRRGDQLLSEAPGSVGTTARCELDPLTEAEWRDLQRSTLPGSSPLSATGHVKLFEHGARFVSRAEAQALLRGMETLRDVRLDFKGVDGVGLGFAQEIFSVWQRAHPEVRLQVLNANAVVRRVLSQAGATFE